MPNKPRLDDTQYDHFYTRTRLSYWGVWALILGLSLYFGAILLSIVRLLLLQRELFVGLIARILWTSGFPTTVGILLIAIDLFFGLPVRRGGDRRPRWEFGRTSFITVALTAYNDELSIGPSVRDFLSHPKVKRVIVVSNNSKDRTMELALEAGAIVFNEERQGYGRCVCRCLAEAAQWEDTGLVALSEGDMTFRAADLDKLVSFTPHSEIVNGTRVVEQLRDYDTQLSTFMYYGNFFVGKLLEVKHLGQGTFTDVGTTYKLIRRESVATLLSIVKPSINLEFNAHLMDTALQHSISIVECPVTFHARVGKSKGGNVNNLRALQVGLRMIWGLTFGWSLLG